MEVQTTGIFVIGECDIQTERCTARTPSPITAVWAGPGRNQTNVCRECLEEMVRSGEWQIEGARVQPRPDIGVVNKYGILKLAVEVKVRPLFGHPNTDTMATRIYRNLMAHGALFPTDYFMLAFYPEPFYLWKNIGRDPSNAEPDYRFTVASVLAVPEHLEDRHMLDEQIAVWSVGDWLGKITSHEIAADQVEPGWLVGSGLGATIIHGTVQKEPSIRSKILF